MTPPTVQTTIADLVTANHILAHLAVVDAFGHVSVRHPERPDRYLLSRSRAPAEVTDDDILEFTLDSEQVTRPELAPYSERFIHGEIYRNRPQIAAICHNHAHSVLPFGITGTPMKPVIHMASVIGSEVGVWDIRDEFGDTDMLVTDSARGASLARSLGTNAAILMRGHGSTVVGGSLSEAVFTAVFLKLNAETILASQQLGPVRALSSGEVELAMRAVGKPLSQSRAWDAWSRAATRSRD
jgi:ribulose-5-phosphate 4-epimerase/fuculose-1-phosphate aldolase